MQIIETRNVNTAYRELMMLVRREGVPCDTRNGPALSIPHPVLVTFMEPRERVLFNNQRNANPFFHLVEALWMIAGRNDVNFISQYNQNISQYSDDGITFNAAYGHRWRMHFGYDQVQRTCEVLSGDPETRRCVIAMWDPYEDLGGQGKDFPCNISIVCRIVDGALDFTITNRSNDLVFGLCGANAVHMSILQEYMAKRIGVRVGKWYHMTNNLHVYAQHYPLLDSIHDGTIIPYPVSDDTVYNWQDFDRDCAELCDGRLTGFREPFFQDTVEPMLAAWHGWKIKDFKYANQMACQIHAADWGIAAITWLKRMEEKHNA